MHLILVLRPFNDGEPLTGEVVYCPGFYGMQCEKTISKYNFYCKDCWFATISVAQGHDGINIKKILKDLNGDD